MSKYNVYTHASNLALVLTNTLSTSSCRRIRDSLLLKYDIIIICHFSHDCVKHPQLSCDSSSSNTPNLEHSRTAYNGSLSHRHYTYIGRGHYTCIGRGRIYEGLDGGGGGLEFSNQ